jgi:hypothetical protein
MGQLEFRVLGPVDVILDGVVTRFGSPTQRTLLALLLMHPNRVVSTDGIVDVLWRDGLPEARRKLWFHVSKLRGHPSARRIGRRRGRSPGDAPGRLPAPRPLRPARRRPFQEPHALGAGDPRGRSCAGGGDAPTSARPLARRPVRGRRPRGCRLVGGRPVERASPCCIRGPTRGQPCAWSRRRADSRARVARRRASLPGALPRSAYSGSLSRRQAGGRARGIPRGAADACRGARARAERGAERAPASGARPRSGALRHATASVRARALRLAHRAGCGPAGADRHCHR